MPAQYGNLAFKAQIAFFRGKVNVPTATWRDVWQSGHDQAFMVAGAAKADLLDDLRKAIAKGIEDGATLRDFRRDFDELVQRHGWTGWAGEGSARGRAWRTRVIWETNLRTSFAAGRWEQLNANKAFAPYLQYVHSDLVQHPRPEHQAWDGLVLHIDDPWWRTHYPPNGWGCQCSVRALTRGQLERRGLAVDDAPPTLIDSATGAPEGIDKGWAYAPGASRPQQLAANLRDSAQKLPPKIKQALLDDIDAALGKRPGKPPTPPAPTSGGASSVLPVGDLSPTFSTVKGITGNQLASVVRQVPGAQAQVDKLAAFFDAHPTKTLVLKAGEIGRGKTAQRIAPAVGKFLDGEAAAGLDAFQSVVRYLPQYTTRKPSRVNGFTSQSYRHVIVKAKAADRLSAVEPGDLASAVQHAIDKAKDNGPLWSVRAALDEVTAKQRPGLVSTWVHEIGHQVHYFAGRPGRPEGSAALTVYSTTNSFEWHAEHFTAWLLNRDALASWQPEIATYFDELIERATQSTTGSGL